MSELDRHGLTNKERNMLFWGSFLALTAAGFGFVFRVMIPAMWAEQFDVTMAEVGALTGAALWPIAVTMIIFSLLVDKIGYKYSMFCAFALQALSVVLTIMAGSYDMMMYACLAAGLGHGIVEAVINPLCATMYREDKTKMLNILHASWPAGIVGGGVIYMLLIDPDTATWDSTKWIFWAMLLPVVAYGVMFAICHKYPVDERIEAGISMGGMMKEFGGLSAFLAITFLFYELSGRVGLHSIQFVANQTLLASAIVGAIGGVIVGYLVKSPGKPLFFILCLIMIPLATAELATDAWIQQLMRPSLGAMAGWAIVMSAGIMMVLRFFAGIPLKFMNPPGLLLLSSAFSIVGLFALSEVSLGPAIFGAFVLYAVGQTFYWPTVLGFVSEQFPRGGAMTLNTVSAMGLLTVGIFGFPFLGAVQDHYNAKTVEAEQPAVYAELGQQKKFFGVPYNSINTGQALGEKGGLSAEDAKALEESLKSTGQSSLKVASVLPGIMAVAFILIILYYRSTGGYKPVILTSGESRPDPAAAPME
jgi:MFS family permease